MIFNIDRFIDVESSIDVDCMIEILNESNDIAPKNGHLRDINDIKPIFVYVPIYIIFYLQKKRIDKFYSNDREFWSMFGFVKERIHIRNIFIDALVKILPTTIGLGIEAMEIVRLSVTEDPNLKIKTIEFFSKVFKVDVSKDI